MAGITFAQFLYGEIGQESGGNYHDQSPAGALGKYQILASNVPSWSKEILGYSVTPDEFLANPMLQDAIAIGKLKKLFNQYGPEGAASAWYTGNPNAWQGPGGGDNYGGPTAAGYVQSVIARAQTYKGDGSDLTYDGTPLEGATAVKNLSGAAMPQSAGGAMPLAQPQKPLTAAQYEQSLGALAGVINSVPELKKALDKAIKNQAPVEDFINDVENSQWYRTHSDATKKYFALQVSDPTEYQHQLQNATAKVSLMAQNMGVGLVGKQAQDLAHAMLIGEWSDAQLQQAIGAHYTANNGGHPNQAGQAAATITQIKQLAQQYGVPVTMNALNTWTQQVLMGANTLDGVKLSIMNSAKTLYPGLTHQLDAGQTVLDVAQPYIATMANTLELPENSLGLSDPTIKKALQSFQNPLPGATTNKQAGQVNSESSADGMQPPGIMPLWQFQNQLRSDPRWEQTNNAKQEAYGMLHQLGAAMGFAS